MSKTRILWIEDEPDTVCSVVTGLLLDYKVDIYMPNNNSRALELAKDRWDLVLYDVGMDRSRTGYDLPVAEKVKQFIGNSIPFIGTTFNPTGRHSDYKEIFDGLIQPYHLVNAKDFVNFAKEYSIEIKKK